MNATEILNQLQAAIAQAKAELEKQGYVADSVVCACMDTALESVTEAIEIIKEEEEEA